MRSWDVIVAGGGIIGLSVALALRRRGDRVLVLERARPGTEASWAAAGMLDPNGTHTPSALLALSRASFTIYPDFVAQLESESGLSADLRREGSIAFAPEADEICGKPLSPANLAALEPALVPEGPAFFMQDASVCPRALLRASLTACGRLGVEVRGGMRVTKIEASGSALAVRMEQETFTAARVLNCCGAWAGEIEADDHLALRPVKGQMLSLVPAQPLLRHMVRAENVYLVPRSDGRILVGATVEEAGFDKTVGPAAIHDLRNGAERLVPALAGARLQECWAGLRPAAPDSLPILGAGSLPGYFLATGHFRNGILLAPITAHCMAQVLHGEPPGHDLAAFAPQRFWCKPVR